jgi:hypothetical protein
MSAERFGAVYFDSTNTNTYVELVPTAVGYERTVIVNFCNNNSSEVTISLAYITDATATSPVNSDILLKDYVLAANTAWQFPAIGLSQTGRLAVKAITGTTVIAHGFKDPI